MNRFTDIMNTEPDRICYGKKAVELAIDSGAVESLLISEKLYKSHQVSERDYTISIVKKSK